MERWDVAVVGAGPNGLTAAAYLARAGARVIVFEARFERGGTLASDDYSTPFVMNQAQLLLPFGADAPPCRDLGLTADAVRFVAPEVAFAVDLDGDALLVGRGGDGLGAEPQALLADADERIAPLVFRPASEAAAALARDGAMPRLAALTPASLAAAAGDERARAALRYACVMAGFFAGDEPLGAIGAFAVARLFSPVLAVGGSKSLANGLFRAAARAGARCPVSARVTGLEPVGDDIEVRIADGRRVRARAVVSTLDPVTTFGELLAPGAAGDVADIGRDWRLDPAGPFTAHFGVVGGGPWEDGPEPAVRLLGFSDADAVAQHADAVAAGRLPAVPAGHLTVTSRLDPLQASPGPHGPLHTVRFQTPAPLDHPAGGWTRERVRHRRRCYDLVRSADVAVGAATLLFEFADSPRDLERRFRTARNGSVRQGSLRPAQTLDRRPDPRCRDGRTPVPGLYLGGGGTHPGVPGALAGGYLAAGAVAADLGLDRWWPEAAVSG